MGSNLRPCISVSVSESHPLNLCIENLTIQNGAQGIASDFVSHIYPGNSLPPTEFLVQDCEIKDCITGTRIQGVGISAFGPIHLERTKIRDNQGQHGSIFSAFSFGGGAYLDNNSTVKTVVHDCEITRNSATEAGGLYLTGNGNFDIIGNKIESNYRRTKPIAGFANNVYCLNTGNCRIMRNVIINDISPGIGSGNSIVLNRCGTTTNPTLIANNTIKGNMTSLPNNSAGLRLIGTECYVKCENNIIESSSVGISKEYLSSVLGMSHCLLFGNNQNFENFIYSASQNPGCILNLDPSLNTNYMPIWNSTVKSPCIDSGKSDADEDGYAWYYDRDDQDTDGSQLDIGAISLIDGHIHSYHILHGGEVKYLCIPALYKPGIMG
jgi:hypothetical protein